MLYNLRQLEIIILSKITWDVLHVILIQLEMLLLACIQQFSCTFVSGGIVRGATMAAVSLVTEFM